jgi:hypothetical protein
MRKKIPCKILSLPQHFYKKETTCPHILMLAVSLKPGEIGQVIIRILSIILQVDHLE